MRFALVSLLVIGSVSAADAQTGKIAPKYGWHAELDKGMAEARATGKPIFLVFRCEP